MRKPLPTLVQALRRAAVRATLAPSVRNLQPWALIVGTRTLELRADLSRGPRGLDPLGRQSVISCGCALFNARVSLAADGWNAVVERYPDPDRPDLLARVSVAGSAGSSAIGKFQETTGLGQLDEAIENRRSSRQPFLPDAVAKSVLPGLILAAAAEGGRLVEITSAADRLIITNLASTPAPSVLLLGTAADGPAAWLWAGEALEHTLLETTRRGYAVCPLSEVLEPAGVRVALRTQLRLSMQPQLIILVGRAEPTPASRRRRLADVLVIAA